MKKGEFEHLLGLLADSNPNSVLLEVAVLESYVSARRARGGWVPLKMIAGALDFFEAEFHWKPRTDYSGILKPAGLRTAL